MTLTQQLQEATSNSPYISRSGIEVEHEDGHVVVRGTVSSFFQKQMAQEELRRIDGVRSIDNRLSVHWASK